MGVGCCYLRVFTSDYCYQTLVSKNDALSYVRSKEDIDQANIQRTDLVVGGALSVNTSFK